MSSQEYRLYKMELGWSPSQNKRRQMD